MQITVSKTDKRIKWAIASWWLLFGHSKNQADYVIDRNRDAIYPRSPVTSLLISVDDDVLSSDSVLNY